MKRSRKKTKKKLSRSKRFRSWHKRMMAEKREDLETMTGNVYTVAKAVAGGKPASLRELKPVRTPLGGFRVSKSKIRKRRRSSRDEACPVTKRSSYPVGAAVESRPPETARRLPGARAVYARQVMLLMRSGHDLSASAALRLVAKWNKFIDTSWRAQKTACWTADHVVKYEARKLCPCEGSSSGRDCSRCAIKRRR